MWPYVKELFKCVVQLPYLVFRLVSCKEQDLSEVRTMALLGEEMVGPCFQHDSCQIQHCKDNTKAFIWTEEELYCPWENAVLYSLFSKAFLFSYTHPLKNIYLIGFRILVKYELNHLYSSSLSVIWHMCSSPSKLILSSTLTLQEGLCLASSPQIFTTSSILTSICPSLTIYTSLWYKWACDAGFKLSHCCWSI